MGAALGHLGAALARAEDHQDPRLRVYLGSR